MRASEFTFNDLQGLRRELAAETLRSSGTLRLKVAGWSMVPTLWPGDVLVIAALDSSTICSGDIVLFARHQRFVAHRVVEKSWSGRGIETRGDAVRQMDAPVSNREILGRVVSIERNGRIIKANRELNATSRSVAAVVRRAPVVARVAVAMHGVVQNLSSE
jgi:signal peptidase I